MFWHVFMVGSWRTSTLGRQIPVHISDYTCWSIVPKKLLLQYNRCKWDILFYFFSYIPSVHPLVSDVFPLTLDTAESPGRKERPQSSLSTRHNPYVCSTNIIYKRTCSHRSVTYVYLYMLLLDAINHYCAYTSQKRRNKTTRAWRFVQKLFGTKLPVTIIIAFVQRFAHVYKRICVHTCICVKYG
jgi:hypothetical protein